MAGAPATMCGMGGGNWQVLSCGVAGQGGWGGDIQCSRAVNKCGMGGKNWRCGRPAQSGVGGRGGWGCGCDLQCRHAGKHVLRGRRELAGAALWGGRKGRGGVRGRTCSAGAQSSTCGVEGGNWPVLPSGVAGQGGGGCGVGPAVLARSQACRRRRQEPARAALWSRGGGAVFLIWQASRRACAAWVAGTGACCAVGALRCGRVGRWGGWGFGSDLQCRCAGELVRRGRRELAGASLWSGGTGTGGVGSVTCSAGAQSSKCSMDGGNLQVLRCGRPALRAGGRVGRGGMWL